MKNVLAVLLLTGLSFCRSIAFCTIGTLLFFGTQVAYSQSSLESDVDNARIIEMTHKGLGDDVIISRIKASAAKFDLSDDDLANLKKAGVSDSVVAAMIQSTQLTSPKVTIDGNPVEVRTIGEQKVGGRLGHLVTVGIKSVKNKAYLQGQHASIIASRKSVIDIQLPANDNIDNYIIVEMDDKGDRREIEMGSVGGTVGEKVGIRADRIVRTSATPVGGRRFRISPVKELKKGEYILYSVGSADFPHGVYGQGYDFTVQ
ncbi:MAG: hypothetical protein WA182_20980 [Candidatus Sulfotelmatobacter sp.]|jgi:hypothetical protein